MQSYENSVLLYQAYSDQANKGKPIHFVHL